MAFTRYKSEQNFDQISENRIVMLKKTVLLMGMVFLLPIGNSLPLHEH